MKFSSLQILQSGCNPRHLNSRAFLDCNGLHLDYMDYMVIKWIAEQCNPKQSKGNLCNPSAIHCNLGLQFCFAIQINLCNLTAIQEDCSLIAEIAVGLHRLLWIAKPNCNPRLQWIALGLHRLPFDFFFFHIYLARVSRLMSKSF